MTDVSAGTDLSTVLNSSGSYRLLGGTHTVSTGFTMATDVELTADEDAVLVIKNGQILTFDDGDVIDGLNILMEHNTRLQANAVSGNTFVSSAQIINNTIRPSGSFTTSPLIRIGQGFGAGAYHRNILIQGNRLYSTRILQEIGDSMKIIGNEFRDMDGLRAIQLWGSNNRVERNYIDGGIFGISLLGKHNIAANRRPCTGNVIASNIVLNTEEEGISMDIVGNIAAETTIREYDTVATTPGSSVITLASGNWSAQTTYNNSLYDLVFVTGTLAGKRYKITTHSGASFTLAGVSADYASINIGDGVSIQLSCYGNFIINNIVIPRLSATRAYTSGIVLHGVGTENVIANNIVYGENDGVGDGDVGAFTNFAIREANLNNITGTDSITLNARRAPVGLNTITNNRSIGGGTGVDYNNYGAAPDYTPIGSTYTDMQEVTREAIGWGGGEYPATVEDFKLKPSSPLRKSGKSVIQTGGISYDYGGRRARIPPDIGVWQRN